MSAATEQVISGLEGVLNNRLIRPRAGYVGPRELQYVAPERR